MIITFFEKSENGDVMIFFLSSHDQFMWVSTALLIQYDVEFEVTVHWCGNANHSLLLECEFQHVCLVVPQVVDPVRLTIMEVFLISIKIA